MAQALPLEVGLVATALSNIQSIRYSESSSTLIVWDHLMTIDKEIELIWNAPWSPGKCLFIANRYYSLIIVIFNNYALFTPHLNDSFCLKWYHWQGWTGLAMCMTAEVILQLRVVALYYTNKKVLLFMLATFLAASAAAATIMGKVLATMTSRSHDIPGFPFCVAYDVSDHFYAFWIPIIFFETFLCALALYRGWQNYHIRSRTHFSGERIFEILVRDSIMYFLVIFATYLVNLILFFTEPNTLVEIPIGFSVAMSCIMGNRLLLNIRETVRDTDLDAQILTSGYVSDIEMDELRAMRAKEVAV